jgi:hypothetical protein
MRRPLASLTGMLTDVSQGKVAFRKFRQAFIAGSDPETAYLTLGRRVLTASVLNRSA